jgi:hypothetical protein
LWYTTILLGLPLLTKEDIDLWIEYILVMKPLAAVLDVFQGEKQCFLGLVNINPHPTVFFFLFFLRRTNPYICLI